MVKMTRLTHSRPRPPRGNDTSQPFYPFRMQYFAVSVPSAKQLGMDMSWSKFIRTYRCGGGLAGCRASAAAK